MLLATVVRMKQKLCNSSVRQWETIMRLFWTVGSKHASTVDSNCWKRLAQWFALMKAAFENWFAVRISYVTVTNELCQPILESAGIQSKNRTRSMLSAELLLTLYSTALYQFDLLLPHFEKLCSDLKFGTWINCWMPVWHGKQSKPTRFSKWQLVTVKVWALFSSH